MAMMAGLEGHDGLARSHIALQQAPHGEWLLHVGSDFLQARASARAVGWNGRIFLIASRTLIVQIERDSGLRLLLAAL